MIVDETMQSLLDYGSPDFPFAFYRDEADISANHNVSWHWHKSLEFSYVAKGTVIFETESIRKCLNSGDAVFINSSILHCFTLQGSSVLENVLFEPVFIAPEGSRVFQTCIAPYLQSNLQISLFRGNDKSQKMIIDRVVQCCNAADSINSEASLRYITIQAKALELWCTFIENVETINDCVSPQIISVTQSRVRKMLSYIYTHYEESIGLSEIAEAAGVSTREALRCFSASIHISPIRYLNQYRLKCAEYLLRNSTQSILEIASRTGYDNSGYFCKTFKKAYGVSPLQYRKKAQLFDSKLANE